MLSLMEGELESGACRLGCADQAEPQQSILPEGMHVWLSDVQASWRVLTFKLALKKTNWISQNGGRENTKESGI
jgi:hypothetical protein